MTRITVCIVAQVSGAFAGVATAHLMFGAACGFARPPFRCCRCFYFWSLLVPVLNFSLRLNLNVGATPIIGMLYGAYIESVVTKRMPPGCSI